MSYGCPAVVRDGGVYGEETLMCDLPVHPGPEHFDSMRQMWWDAETKVRVTAARRAELEKTRAT